MSRHIFIYNTLHRHKYIEFSYDIFTKGNCIILTKQTTYVILHIYRSKKSKYNSISEMAYLDLSGLLKCKGLSSLTLAGATQLIEKEQYKSIWGQ